MNPRDNSLQATIEVMKTIEQIRLENLRRLYVGSGLLKKDFAASLDVEPTYLSRLFTQNPSQKKKIGDTLARRAEAAYGRPVGWMDRLHPENEKASLFIEKFLALPEVLRQEALKHLDLLAELAERMRSEKDQDRNR